MQKLLSAVNKLGRAIVGHPMVDRIARPAWCALTACIPLDLTYSDATHWISLELTSRCNLRCVYCGKSWNKNESERAFDFPEEWIAPSMKTLQQRGLIGVIASGIGETTIREGWQAICRSFHDAGLNLTIISNFARQMTPEDIATLARFSSIQVSIDTSDPELFARLRRGARLETVLANIDKVLEYSKSDGLPQPEFRFDIVVADKTIRGMEGVVRLGMKHGVTDFYFANLYKGGEAAGGFNVYNSTTLPKAELAEGLASLECSIELVKSAGCKVECHSGLIEGIRAKLNVTASACDTLRILGEGGQSWGAPGVGKGMTRDCSDPWKYATLCAHGEVRPCCAYDYPIGDLHTESLEEVLNGPKLRKFRQDLLSGNLEEHLCKHCSMRPQIAVGEFQRRMRGRLVLYSVRRRVLNALKFITR